MKTKAIKLTAILMILTVGAFASGNFGGEKSGKAKNSTVATINPVSTEMVEIRIMKSAEDQVNMVVYNENGKKVYQTTLSSGMNIRISHDISEFPFGQYTYKILEGEKIIHTCMILKTKETILKLSPDSENAAAYISQHNNKVEVSLLKTPGTDTRIVAMDQAGNVVYTEGLNNETSQRFTHDISGFPAGDFIFTIYAGNERIAERSIVKK